MFILRTIQGIYLLVLGANLQLDLHCTVNILHGIKFYRLITQHSKVNQSRTKLNNLISLIIKMKFHCLLMLMK